MTLNKLASLIAKREGKRSQARIGDIREVLKIIATLEAEDIEAHGAADGGPLYTLCEYTNKVLAKMRRRGR